MAKVILICGKICCGKTHYCKQLQDKYQAVLLSCDEIESRIFHNSLGKNHDAVIADIKIYLRNKAADIVSAGSNVMLDWGFWNKSEREEISKYYKLNDIAYEWHYIDISDANWKLNIAARNKAVKAHETTDYYVDEGLLKKLESMFEMPDKNEIDVWFVNNR